MGDSESGETNQGNVANDANQGNVANDANQGNVADDANQGNVANSANQKFMEEMQKSNKDQMDGMFLVLTQKMQQFQEQLLRGQAGSSSVESETLPASPNSVMGVDMVRVGAGVSPPVTVPAPPAPTTGQFHM